MSPAQVADSLERIAAFIDGNDVHTLRAVYANLATVLGAYSAQQAVATTVGSLQYRADELRNLAKELRK